MDFLSFRILTDKKILYKNFLYSELSKFDKIFLNFLSMNNKLYFINPNVTECITLELYILYLDFMNVFSKN